MYFCLAKVKIQKIDIKNHNYLVTYSGAIQYGAVMGVLPSHVSVSTLSREQKPKSVSLICTSPTPKTGKIDLLGFYFQ